MYSLEEPTQSDKEYYCNNICDINRVRNNIEAYVNNTKSLQITVSNLTVNIAIIQDSITDAFLRDLLEDDNLKKLLCGNIDYLKTVVADIEQKRLGKHYSLKDFYYHRLTKTHIENLIGRQLIDNDTVDITKAILYDIFVTEGYENEEIFNKDGFVKSLDLRVCPYCGRAYIYSVDNLHRMNGTHTVKPQIDHFFPKSKYPYLALSYQNLIPVCTTCNAIGAKGDNEPIIENVLRFPYPYRFKDSDIQFHCIFMGTDLFKDENFCVSISYSNSILEDGCKKILSLNDLYAYHNHEAREIYAQIDLLLSKATKYYKKLSLPESMFAITPQMVLGFSFSNDASRNELLYRFKHDLYFQFLYNI